MNNLKLNALIVESNQESGKNLEELILSFPDISLVKRVANSEEALLTILNYTPDIIFLEFPAPGKSGKQLIRFIKAQLPSTIIILISSSKEYASDAIHHEIFNYLLKPVTPEELKKVIHKALTHRQSNLQNRINQLLNQTPEETKLRFQTVRGYVFVDPDEIIYCKADGPYTEFIPTNGQTFSCPISLTKIEQILSPLNFLRISRSNLINMRYLRKIFKDSNSVSLSVDGKEYLVKGSRSQIRNLLKSDNE